MIKMNEENSSELLEGWEVKPFTKCFKNISPGDKKIKRRDYLEEGKISVIDQGEEFIGGYTNETSKKQDIELPIIIFGDHTRRFKYVNLPFAVGADGTKILKVNNDLLDNKFAYYQCLQIELPNKGYSRHFQFLKKVDFRVPESKEEQTLIVQEIEKQFTRLDAAVKSLKSVKNKLEVYRKSVLKAAFKGKLIESKSDWISKNLSEEFKIIMGQSPPSKYYNTSGEGLPFFQGKKEFTNLYPKIETWSTESSKIADRDDVLLSIRAPIGPVNLAPSKCGIGRGLAAIKPNNKTKSKLIFYLIKSHENDLIKRGTGTTFEAITKSNLYSLPIKLPDSEENRDSLLQEIESRFSVIEKLEETVDNALVKAEQLRKSILKSAFEGRILKYNRGDKND